MGSAAPNATFGPSVRPSLCGLRADRIREGRGQAIQISFTAYAQMGCKVSFTSSQLWQ